ncbi:MAG: hypothetical protein E7619_04080 [Ruminococcaceae bacterium]|nr:hypothetical protein [Oscillospiraceae bacterium]
MSRRRTTRRAVQASAMALLLCFVMLAGTTAAWFTDSVQTGINTIQAGNLDIELYYAYPSDVVNGAIADNKWKVVTADTPVFDPNALWEPGYTEVVYFKAVNEGELALKYLMNVDIVSETLGLTKTGASIKLSDHILAYAIQAQQGHWAPFANREAVTDPASLPAEFNGVPGKTLAEAADGYAYGNPPANPYSLDLDQWLQPGECWYTSLALYMPETVGNEANHDGEHRPSIQLGISLVATQYNWDPEDDSFDHNYDANATLIVNDVNDLQAAINAAKDGAILYLKSGDHVLKSGPIVINGKDVSIIGLGEVSILKDFMNTHVFTVSNGSKVLFQNLDIDGNAKNREGIYVRNDCNVTIVDCSIKNTGGKDIMIDEASDAAHGLNSKSTVTLINSDVEDVAACASPVTSVSATQDTYVYFNFDADSVVGNIEKQSINLKPENIFINGDNSGANGGIKYNYISTAADLLALAGKSLEGTYILSADIDLEGAALGTIGAAYGKTLTIVGNGHTISNGKSAHTSHNGMKHHGMFYAYTDSTLNISNLVIDNFDIDSTADTERNYGAGVVVAFADGGCTVVLDNVDVKNCDILNNVPDIGDEAGVYVGYQTGTLIMKDCDSTACTVVGETAEKTGAFIGMVNGTATLTNCTTDLTIGTCNRVAGTLTEN